jgi:hypothetical protein
LRRYFLAKYASLQAEGTTMKNIGDNYDQKRKDLEEQISNLELFVSIENAVNYCRENAKDPNCAKKWKDHSNHLSDLQ